MSLQQLFTQSPFDPATVSTSLWLIILLPLVGAFICGVFGRVLGRANTHAVALGAVGGSFLIGVVAFWTIAGRFAMEHGALRAATLENPYGETLRWAIGQDLGKWFSAGSFVVHFGLRVDHLSGILLLVITGVGFLIHLYSTSYMEHDDGYWRYFAYLNLFVAMMLTLVLADNLLLMFVGWEGVGLCSYLLIGFWYTDPAKAWAGRKAFVTNRIGDFGFLIGTFLLIAMMAAFSQQAGGDNWAGASGTSEVRWETAVTNHGPLDYRALEEMARVLPASPATAARPGALTLESPIMQGPLEGFTFGGVLTAVLLLFLLGAAGKSAQLPLYVWLPDAMAGPTPVSALIHAATMVTAGVYLFARLNYLLVLSPVAMATIAIVGGLTALLAALIAFAQDDIKKVLAYSTVSQLGLMFVGIGVGAFWAAVLHLLTHAFFKACLFLGAGSVMHGNADETDIKKLGGLRHEMKWTWLTFLVATLAITGVVPLSGFFSKDAILHAAHSTTLAGLGWATQLAWFLGIATALCTAFYMTRVYWLTFHGKRSPQARIPHAHESAGEMTFPLVVLAILSVVGLVWGLPIVSGPGGPNSETPIQNFLRPVLARGNALIGSERLIEVHHSSVIGAWVLALVIAWAGALAAVFMYAKFFPSMAGKPVPGIVRAVRKAAQQKFWVDELYDMLLIRRIRDLALVLFRVVDSLLIDTLLVRGSAWVTRSTGSVLRYLQTGDVQSYAAMMAVAILVGAAYVVMQVLR